jgi:hypothetical protein
MEKGNTVINAGPVSVAMSYRRELMPDQGLMIQVYGDVNGEDTEILRFDCFDQAPHYHYGPENHNIRLPMDKTTAGNPVGWTLGQLRNNLPSMVKRAGYDELAARLGSHAIPAATMDEIEHKARELARVGRRTVHHKLERLLEGDMIEAGNIRFGLEFREVNNDRGLAIHVLSDVADEEVELLAFDCFEVGPHYHYGPRNQDVRIYWDTTTSGDTLRWTLDQFKAGKLRSMIERAGYPSISSAVDESLVQSLMPKIEARSFELVAMNSKSRGGMKDRQKTKAQLIDELEALRQQVAAL